MKEKVRIGNSHSSWLASIVLKHHEKLIFWVENPDSSWLWRQPEWLEILGSSKAFLLRLDFLGALVTVISRCPGGVEQLAASTEEETINCSLYSCISIFSISIAAPLSAFNDLVCPCFHPSMHAVMSIAHYCILLLSKPKHLEVEICSAHR